MVFVWLFRPYFGIVNLRFSMGFWGPRVDMILNVSDLLSNMASFWVAM